MRCVLIVGRRSLRLCVDCGLRFGCWLVVGDCLLWYIVSFIIVRCRLFVVVLSLLVVIGCVLFALLVVCNVLFDVRCSRFVVRCYSVGYCCVLLYVHVFLVGC